MTAFVILAYVAFMSVIAVWTVEAFNREKMRKQYANEQNEKKAFFEALDKKYYCKVSKKQLKEWRTGNWQD